MASISEEQFWADSVGAVVATLDHFTRDPDTTLHALIDIYRPVFATYRKQSSIERYHSLARETYRVAWVHWQPASDLDATLKVPQEGSWSDLSDRDRWSASQVLYRAEMAAPWVDWPVLHTEIKLRIVDTEWSAIMNIPLADASVKLEAFRLGAQSAVMAQWLQLGDVACAGRPVNTETRQTAVRDHVMGCRQCSVWIDAYRPVRAASLIAGSLRFQYRQRELDAAFRAAMPRQPRTTKRGSGWVSRWKMRRSTLR